jgi:hypothetical protein
MAQHQTLLSLTEEGSLRADAATLNHLSPVSNAFLAIGKRCLGLVAHGLNVQALERPPSSAEVFG